MRRIPSQTKSRRLRTEDFVGFIAFCIFALGCAHAPSLPVEQGFDVGSQSFDSVESVANTVRAPAASDDDATGAAHHNLPFGTAELRPIVRGGGAGRASPLQVFLVRGDASGSSQPNEALLEPPRESKQNKESEPKGEGARGPASVGGQVCETGYDCPSGQFCRQVKGAKTKTCVGGTGSVTYCQSSSDCPGGNCADRGDGAKICMGNGFAGDACTSNTHCNGGFCRDRGDGVKLCMGSGQRNAPCVTASDCSSGSCKDRGDGLKICM